MNLESTIQALGAFDVIGYSERVYLYFAAVIFIKACCAGAFAEFALWLSTKITNVFVTTGGTDAGVLRFEYADDVAAYAEQILPRYAL